MKQQITTLLTGGVLAFGLFGGAAAASIEDARSVRGRSVDSAYGPRPRIAHAGLHATPNVAGAAIARAGVVGIASSAPQGTRVHPPLSMRAL
jgi:hypothetical protein